MPKLTIEINDTLQECVDSAIEDVKAELLSWLAKNPDTEKCPCMHNDLDYSGAIHEIIDGSVPIYTHEINTIFFLHGAEVESAFDDAGIGEKEDKGWPNGWKAAAVYCFIESRVHQWFADNAEEFFLKHAPKSDAALENR